MENREIMQHVYDALNAHDLDALDAYIARDVIIHGMEAQGLAALKAEMINYFAGVPDFRVEIHQIIAAGDRAGAWITCAGTHTGNLWGLSPTGRTLALPELDLARVEGGKVAEYWVLSDEAAFMAQVG
jgi:predicted ester cyclase